MFRCLQHTLNKLFLLLVQITQIGIAIKQICRFADLSFIHFFTDYVADSSIGLYYIANLLSMVEI